MKRFVVCILAIALLFSAFSTAEPIQNDPALDIALGAAEKLINLISMDGFLDWFSVPGDTRKIILSYTGDWASKDKLIDSTVITIPELLFDTLYTVILMREPSAMGLAQYSDYIMQSMATLPINLLNSRESASKLSASSIAHYSEIRYLENITPGITYVLLDYGFEHPYIAVAFIVAEDHAATVNASLLMVDREVVETFLNAYSSVESVIEYLFPN